MYKRSCFYDLFFVLLDLRGIHSATVAGKIRPRGGSYDLVAVETVGEGAGTWACYKRQVFGSGGGLHQQNMVYNMRIRFGERPLNGDILME